MIACIHYKCVFTRIFFLFQCGDFINLKILEITPEIASLGATLQEAEELQKAHNEVLRQLQVQSTHPFIP